MDEFSERGSPTLDQRADLFRWTDELHTACLLLCMSSALDVRSVSVSLSLPRSPEAEALARERVRRIAEEYGLAWMARLVRGSLTASFARPGDSFDLPDGNR